MKARNGQVAIYLALVIVAICVLVMMNVGAFLSVRGKNRAMNAGDAAALAVAGYQGKLLNDIGAMNVEHLKAALRNDENECREIMERQLRTCFLDPLKGIGIGAEAASRNGAADFKDDMSERLQAIFREHISDIRNYYANDNASFPEPWEGAWSEYAAELELQLAQNPSAWPDNAEFADARESFPLACQDFYYAIAGRAWCWFKFNGEWLFDRSPDRMPLPDFNDPGSRFNSEIYPLHVKFEALPQVLDEEWTNIIKRLADCSESDIAASTLITNQTQRWAFYDHRWDQWSTYPGIAFSPDEFPIVGEVKREYDVLGCAAICRVATVTDSLVFGDGGERVIEWTAGAKPFGSVENLDGETDVVTAFRRFVVPAFETMRLVPIDSVGGRDLHTADADWLDHVRCHLASSPHYNPAAGAGCWFCAQLTLWSQESFRRQGSEWLRYNSSGCVRPTGGGSYRGGTTHGH